MISCSSSTLLDLTTFHTRLIHFISNAKFSLDTVEFAAVSFSFDIVVRYYFDLGWASRIMNFLLKQIDIKEKRVLIDNSHLLLVVKSFLAGFKQSQPLIVVQDEVIRRFIRGFFPQNVVISGEEVSLHPPVLLRCFMGSIFGFSFQIVIKRRGNIVTVAGFLQYSRRLDIRRIYWMFGFAEEFLSILLKQPVKLELAFVESEADVAYNYI